MSLYGALFSGVSGLTAQSSAMGAISDNITNVSTIGYKGTTVNFQTLVTKQTSSTFYSAGGVQSKPRQQTDVQGLLQASTSSTDIAIAGGGFYVVNQANVPGVSDPYLFTRAGSFIQDDQGFLKNSAGYYLQGWPTDAAGTVVTSNKTLTVTNQNIISSDYMESINLNRVGGTASPTTNIGIGANLPVTGPTAEAGATHKTDVQFVDSLGSANNLSVVYTKTTNKNEWDVSVAPPPGTAVSTLRDNQTPTPGIYASAGQVEFTAVPAALSTIKIGFDTATAKTYTFVNGAPATGFEIQVDGAKTLSQVVSALVAAVKAKDQAFTVDTNRIAVKPGVTTAIEFNESGVGAIFVDLSNTLNSLGAAVTNQTGTFTVEQKDNLYSDFSMLRFGGTNGTTLPTNNDIITVNGNKYGFDMNGDGIVTGGATVIPRGVAQVDTVTIGGTVDIGDIFSVTVNGNAYPFTAATTSANDVATGLRNAINAGEAGVVTVTGATNVLTITADVVGTAFTSPTVVGTTPIVNTANTQNLVAGASGVSTGAGAPATQVFTITADGLIPGAGDSYSMTIDPTGLTGAGGAGGAVTFTYTALATDTVASIETALLGKINTALAGASAGYTVLGNGAGVITATAANDTLNDTFTGAVASATNAVVNTNTTPTLVNTTANIALSLGSLIASMKATIEANDSVLATTGLRVRTFDLDNDGVLDSIAFSTVNNDINDIDTSGISTAARPLDGDKTPYASTTISVATTAGMIFTSGGAPKAFNAANIEILGFTDGAQDMSDATGEGKRITLDFGTVGGSDGMTQFGNAFKPDFSNQNGSQFGTFSGVTIGTDGLVTAKFDNGETRKIFQIPVATFVNPNQLDNRSGNVWSSTQNSGDYTLRVADSGSAGQVVQSTLEASTVDIGAEFTSMIVVQRAYSASTKIISTADQMLEELMRVKR